MREKLIYIGRSLDNDIVLEDPTVSRKHAVLKVFDNNSIFLNDLDSSNGTFINSERITELTEVVKHDEILLGKLLLDWNLLQPYLFHQKEVNLAPKNEKKNRTILPWIVVIVISALVGILYIPKQKLQDPAEKETNTTEVADTTLSNTSENQVSIKNETNPQKSGSTEANPAFRIKKSPIEYSISCLRNSTDVNKIIGFGADVEHGWISFSSDEVAVEEEKKVGDELKKHVENDYRYSTNSHINKRIKSIFQKLLNALKKPRMPYQVYVIESKEINAFTAGGYVYITTGIIQFANSDDELACILAHEIYHNELGHINLMIRKEKAARNWLGDFADWGLVASQIFGASFNQENEVYCDMYGVDLAIAAGYNGKVAVDFWKRMKANGNGLEKIFSTHPFSNERMNCIHDHLERNYE
jgi:pSer/pThr/pTyr-binding forkhead associated (FHA) protein